MNIKARFLSVLQFYIYYRVAGLPVLSKDLGNSTWLVILFCFTPASFQFNSVKSDNEVLVILLLFYFSFSLSFFLQFGVKMCIILLISVLHSTSC